MLDDTYSFRSAYLAHLGLLEILGNMSVEVFMNE